MFDIAPQEFLLVGIVALIVIGPKDLPKAMRIVGYWVGRARGVARQFRAGFDTMMREAELQEMEKKWAEENARIMREHPPTPAMLPLASDSEHEDPPVMLVEPPVIAPAPQAEPEPEPAPVSAKPARKTAKPAVDGAKPAAKRARKPAAKADS